MCIISMKSKKKRSGTAVPNCFIDRYMLGAEASYLRVYLYLLRHYTGSNPDRRDPADFSIAAMAERLECMESDICRALKYWARKGLLTVSFDDNDRVSGIELVDMFEEPDESEPLAESVAPVTPVAPVSSENETSVSAVSEDKPDYKAIANSFRVSPELQDRFSKDPAYRGLTEIIEAMMNRELSPDLYELMLFAYDKLRFPRDLVAYLFEYCLEINKLSAGFIRKVAITWAENGVISEEDAKLYVTGYDNAAKAVRKQFGFRRGLGEDEILTVRRWSRTWAMPAELIEEACRRTMKKTGNPNFGYADAILRSWHDAGRTTLEDVRREDEEHASQSAPAADAAGKKRASRKNNAFTDYGAQREYTDEEYAALELAMRNRH
ncbi:MAG: DnaD domain protein [Lachnospiraceae bacterium]|nr:DnaD domain protein [Lachnospiraceae bacterium]